MKKTYLFVYNDLFGTREQVKQYINSIPQISHWRFDLPNCFYIVSEYDSNTLANFFMNLTGRRGFFILAEIVPSNSQGLLSEGSWYLINNKNFHPNA
jgi:hypothetical protein